MLETIGAILVVIFAIAFKILTSRSFHSAINRSLAEETEGNLNSNLELYEQMKAAKARGEDFSPSNYR
jgi:hypothetical protein